MRNKQIYISLLLFLIYVESSKQIIVILICYKTRFYAYYEKQWYDLKSLQNFASFERRKKSDSTQLNFKRE